jgi:hypothetical protein
VQAGVGGRDERGRQGATGETRTTAGENVRRLDPRMRSHAGRRPIAALSLCRFQRYRYFRQALRFVLNYGLCSCL